MPVMRLEAECSAAEKRRWKIVRTDSFTDVAGEIVSADEATGKCLLLIESETRIVDFGSGGMKIVRR